MKTLLERPFVRKSILIAGIAVGLYVVITFFVPLVIPFLIAFLFAALMQPLIGFLENKLHFSHKIAFITTALIFIIAFVVLGIVILKLTVDQAKNFITCYPFYQAKLMDGLCGCCDRIDGWLKLGSGVSYTYFTSMFSGLAATFTDSILPKLTTGSVRALIIFFNSLVFFFVTGIATLLFAKQYHSMGEKLKKNRAGQFVNQCGHNLFLALSAYMRAQFFIMLINWVILSIMFYLIRTPYYVLMGALVAVLDALPFVGSGLILIPWGLVLLFMGFPVHAAYVAVGYLLCSCIREVLEPKLIGNRIGISTLSSLVCMYVGLKLFGILGFLFGPVAFLIGKEMYGVIWEEMNREVRE